MKTLYLLRHAHAEPRPESIADYYRPLTEQGEEEAHAVADYLAQEKIMFDFVMCSGAIRAEETLEPLRAVVGTEDIEISENFYNSPEDKILNNLQHVADKWERILYIGHNPGIAFAAFKFTKTFPQELMESVRPATLIGFQFPIDHWSDLAWWEGQVIDHFQPPLPSPDTSAPRES